MYTSVHKLANVALEEENLSLVGAEKVETKSLIFP
jgi:hypothetical protein